MRRLDLVDVHELQRAGNRKARGLRAGVRERAQVRMPAAGEPSTQSKSMFGSSRVTAGVPLSVLLAKYSPLRPLSAEAGMVNIHAHTMRPSARWRRLWPATQR